ncbi:MAG: efflux RND transporter periplasmic adaptor subunit [Lautropia sp.]
MTRARAARSAGIVAAQAVALRAMRSRTVAALSVAVLAIAALTAPLPAGAQPAPGAAETPRVLLIPERETTLVAQMVGTVQKLGGDLGAAFKQGAPLIRFDCNEQRARLGMARAELNSAEEQHRAKVRLQGLAAAGEVEVALAAAAVAKARAQLDLGNAQLAQCTVPAPFSGRISKLHVREFQGVNIGQPLLDIVSSGPLKLRLNAPSRWLSWLKRGTAFEVRIDETGRDYPAVVSAINARVDAVSQSIELEGQINGRFPELLAGMSGTARFTAPR